MSDPGTLVSFLYELCGRRDWDTCASLLHRDAIHDLPRTGDHLEGGAAVLDYQRAYPEPWGELSVRGVKDWVPVPPAFTQ